MAFNSCGRCSGAKRTIARIAERSSGVIGCGRLCSVPPWTTRWPTASISAGDCPDFRSAKMGLSPSSDTFCSQSSKIFNAASWSGKSQSCSIKFPGGGANLKMPAFETDPLQTARQQESLGLPHLVQGAFDARRAAVDRQDPMGAGVGHGSGRKMRVTMVSDTLILTKRRDCARRGASITIVNSRSQAEPGNKLVIACCLQGTSMNPQTRVTAIIGTYRKGGVIDSAVEEILASAREEAPKHVKST